MDVKKGDTVVLAGTRKGLFALASRDRRRWKAERIGFDGNQVYHAMLGPDGKSVYAAASSEHWGASVQRAPGVGKKWTPAAITYPKESGMSVARVWHVAAAADGTLYAGVEPAGLFRSEDQGKTWSGVDGLNARPGRDKWMPGGGGLCLHTILPHPTDARRMVVAASAVGVFETKDGGASWKLINEGLRNEGMEQLPHEGDAGTCPHKLVRDAADPDTLYMQNHWGVYRRRSGESKWSAIDAKLPSRFGFPMVAHPHEAQTVYTVPLAGDFDRVTPEGAMAVHRTKDGGRSWTRLAKGLPQKQAFLTVLRDGMATDGKDPAGIYVGTTGGQLFASRDDGDSWDEIASTLPPILSVSAGIAR